MKQRSEARDRYAPFTAITPGRKRGNTPAHNNESRKITYYLDNKIARTYCQYTVYISSILLTAQTMFH